MNGRMRFFYSFIPQLKQRFNQKTDSNSTYSWKKWTWSF